MRREKTWSAKLSLVVTLLVAGATLILLTLLPAFAQEPKAPESPKPWTGKLADGQVITKADLDRILEEHACG